jgi:ATP-dependent Clp protease ATP-binding subunit ClpA
MLSKSPLTGAAMFERYTEKSRRAIFFGRYEASQAGSPYICTEHLLLGLLRDSSATIAKHLKIDTSELASRLTGRPYAHKMSTSVDLPLDADSKRALAYAAEESEQMGHKFIGTEHLLLGVMREEKSGAAQVLKAMGAPTLAEVRKSVAESVPEAQASTQPHRPPIRIKLINQSSAWEFAMLPRLEALPRIGETVVIRLRDTAVPPGQAGEGRIFCVTDVQWKFEVGLSETEVGLRIIEVLLRPEQPAH